MINAVVYTLISVLAISLISLIGVFTLAINKKKLNKLIILFVSFSAGAMFGAVFFELLPESYDALGSKSFVFVLLGIVIFFVLETFLFWYHHHEQCTHHGKHKHCTTHRPIKPVGYLNLMGDTLHNIIDGMIIATSYLVDIQLGLVTTLAVLLHELPQELGDFGILLHSGFSVKRAIMFNLLSALSAFFGVFFIYLIGDSAFNISYVLPIAAGGFLYIAGSDLLPELHKTKKISRSILQFLIFLLGIGIIYLGHYFFRT